MIHINVRLLLNRVQYDPTADLKKISDYLTPRGVVPTFSIQDTDITGYTTVEQKNPFGNYQYVLNGAETLVEPFLKESDDICVLVIQGYKEFGTTMPSECENKVYIPGTQTVFISVNADDPFSDTQPNFFIWLLHAIYHGLGTMASYAGFPVDDCMDVLTNFTGQKLYYFRNYEPEDVNSNHINMMERLQPWISSNPQKKSMNHAILIRKPDQTKETLGSMTAYAHGVTMTLSTLELPWLNNAKNISCIPAGTYLCKWAPFYQTHHYELQDVTGRSGIFIHNGNYVKDSLGCIVVGVNPTDLNGDGVLDVTNSVVTLNAFENLFNKEDFTLTIV